MTSLLLLECERSSLLLPPAYPGLLGILALLQPSDLASRLGLFIRTYNNKSSCGPRLSKGSSLPPNSLLSFVVPFFSAKGIPNCPSRFLFMYLQPSPFGHAYSSPYVLRGVRISASPETMADQGGDVPQWQSRMAWKMPEWIEPVV